MAGDTPVSIGVEQQRQFRNEGYFVLPKALASVLLTIRVSHDQSMVDESNREMDQRGIYAIGVNHRSRQYLYTNCFQ